MLLLLAYLALALIVSFLCSILEAVLLSTPQSFLLVKQEEGSAWAKSFHSYKENVDRPLSAILSMNTVAHTIGAAGVGAQAVEVFGEAYFGAVSAVLTVLILVFTEIIPKTVGARYWRLLAKFSYYLINVMVILTLPLVYMASLITKVFAKKEGEQTVSREEIAALASIGADEGVFSQSEHKILQNVLMLKNIKATEVMTPRVVVSTANEETSLSDFFHSEEYSKFSRIPVYAENEEHITGYVFRQDILEKLADDHHDIKLKDIKRKILIVHNSLMLFSLWETLLENKEHLTLIVDEYGGMDGIVTMEDVIETMLGREIVDETDAIPDMQEYARKKWKNRQNTIDTDTDNA